MKVIKVDLPRELDSIELHIFADEHLGDVHCDVKRLLQRIEYVKNTPNAYCLLNGDIIDNATKTSVGDNIYSQKLNPMQQLAKAVELFSPIADKCLCITHGNHEDRTMKNDGICISALLAQQLGLHERYTSTSALLFVRFGEESAKKKETNGSGNIRRICYSIYALHGSGSGSGRREGGKINKLADMAAIIDADVYVHGHQHLPIIMKQAFYRTDVRNSTVGITDRLFVNTASNLDYDGSYGEYGAYKPNSKETPVIYLSGRKKSAWAKL